MHLNCASLAVIDRYCAVNLAKWMHSFRMVSAPVRMWNQSTSMYPLRASIVTRWPCPCRVKISVQWSKLLQEPLAVEAAHVGVSCWVYAGVCLLESSRVAHLLILLYEQYLPQSVHAESSSVCSRSQHRVNSRLAGTAPHLILTTRPHQSCQRQRLTRGPHRFLVHTIRDP